MRRSGRLTAVVGVAGITALLAGKVQAQATPVATPGISQERADNGTTPTRHRGEFAGMGRIMGEVTAVSGSTLTVKAENGESVQVVTTDNTHVMKDRGPVKLSDLHVGDGLMAMGNMDAPNKTLHAAVVMAEDAAQIKAMRDNLGKTYITGRVTSIDLDDAKLTLDRADHVAQTIGFDETTSFKRAVRHGEGGTGNGAEESGGPGRGAGSGRGPGGGFGGGLGMAMGNGMDRAFENGESITLADIKVGDFVAGTGSVKHGVFTPTRLVDSPSRRGHGTPGEGAAAPGAAGPANPGPIQR